MKQGNYIIGIDLGINNVGWSILNQDSNKIEKTGVRLFNPSNAAEDRRLARGVKRRSKREKTRINDTYKLLEKIGFVERRTIDNELLKKRVDGLNSQITKQDIVNIIMFFMSHRGYIPFDDEEINFIDLKGKYPCEYYYQNLKETGKYRAQNETVKNIELQKELIDILNKQIEYYPNIQDIKDDIIKIFIRKREFWEGPGSDKVLTPYGRFKTEDDREKYYENKKNNPSYEKYLFEDLIGMCEIYPEEKKATKVNYFAQKFNLLNDFINLTFSNVEDTLSLQDFKEVKNGYKLSTHGLEKVIRYCLECDKTLKNETVFKDLFNIDIKTISGFRKDKDNKIELSKLDDWRQIKRISLKHSNYPEEIFSDIDAYNLLMYYINVSPSSIKLMDMILKDNRFKGIIKKEDFDFIVEVYKNVNKGYHSLSEKALIRATEDMISSEMNFQQVRKKFDYDKQKREMFAKEYEVSGSTIQLSTRYIDEIIASPQVKKSLRQAIKVINAIIKEKGSLPYCIAIESTKEMNSKEKIKKINLTQKRQEGIRKEAKQIIEEHGYQPTHRLIEKVMLYKELDGRCPYCNNVEISLDDVLNNRIEVEHILPLSKTGNDSYNNKTLACQKCNSSSGTGKGNRSPYEWKRTTDFEDFSKRISNNIFFSEEKKNNFLFTEDIDKYSIRFFNRNLRDTAYATTELVKQIGLLNYYLKDKYNLSIKTLSTPGQVTSKLRREYDLEKNRDDGKYHHAVDASIVASIANTSLGKIIIESQNNEQYWIKNKNKMIETSKLLYAINIKDNIDYIKNINNENIKISSQVLKNNSGALANANIVKYINAHDCINKVSKINNIYEEKNSELLQYFNENAQRHLMIKDNNPKLFKLLKEILEEYKDEPGNAFKNYCFDKYKNDVNFQTIKDFDINKHGICSSMDKNSPVVKSLRYYSKVGNPFILNKKNINKKTNTMIGLDSLSQSFVEIYYDKEKNKFAFMPIYSIFIKDDKIDRTSSFYLELKEEFLPNNDYEFITRVYNGDSISVEKKDGKVVDGTYSYFDKSTNSIRLKEKDAITCGIVKFQIHNIDVLGNKKERLTYKIK